MITIVAGIYTFRDVIPVFFSDKETLARSYSYKHSRSKVCIHKQMVDALARCFRYKHSISKVCFHKQMVDDLKLKNDKLDSNMFMHIIVDVLAKIPSTIIFQKVIFYGDKACR